VVRTMKPPDSLGMYSSLGKSCANARLENKRNTAASCLNIQSPSGQNK
jgi:hypothetical protein